MFVVVELQKNGETVSNIVTTHETLNEAESKYHQVLMAAAISTVQIHSAVLLNDSAIPLRHEHYTHDAE